MSNGVFITSRRVQRGLRYQKPRFRSGSILHGMIQDGIPRSKLSLNVQNELNTLDLTLTRKVDHGDILSVQDYSRLQIGEGEEDDFSIGFGTMDTGKPVSTISSGDGVFTFSHAGIPNAIVGIGCVCSGSLRAGEWWIRPTGESSLEFSHGDHIKATLNGTLVRDRMKDNSVYRLQLNAPNNEDLLGLIVASTGKFYGMTGSTHPTTSDALPVVELAQKENAKSVFGVLIGFEETGNSRVYRDGAFTSLYPKVDGIDRVIVRSTGTGTMWVCSKNGDIELGDCIVASGIPGYGMKQVDDVIRSSTVAKATMPCPFQAIESLSRQRRQIPEIINGHLNLDVNGNAKMVGASSEEGDPLFENLYEIRYLLLDGTRISREDFVTRIVSGENVIRAVLLGCTFQCG